MVVLTALIWMFLAFGISAQETTMDDELFGEGSSIDAVESRQTATTSTPEVASSTATTTFTDVVKVGGAMSFSLGLDIDPSELAWPDSRLAFPYALSSKVYIDARPSDDLRFFIKAKASSPFASADNFAITEMFADITMSDVVYLRLGKQTINWGVGRFFSPANIINLSTIDPENPDEELVGPLAVKIQLPQDSNNYYAYGIVNDLENNKAIDLGIKGEWVLGDTELGLGGVYRFDRPWAVATTVSTKLWDFDLYAEGVLKGQDERNFLLRDDTAPNGLRTETRRDQLFWYATTGFSLALNDDDNYLNLDLSGQYYFNSSGYLDPSIFTTQPDGITSLALAGQISSNDLFQRGMHNSAARADLSDIYSSDIGVSTFWVSNLLEQSGKVVGTVYYMGFSKLKISLSYTGSYGARGTEFNPQDKLHSITLGFKIVDGIF
jgi:hypothetical protein